MEKHYPWGALPFAAAAAVTVTLVGAGSIDQAWLGSATWFAIIALRAP